MTKRNGTTTSKTVVVESSFLSAFAGGGTLAPSATQTPGGIDADKWARDRARRLTAPGKGQLDY